MGAVADGGSPVLYVVAFAVKEFSPENILLQFVFHRGREENGTRKRID